MWRIPAIAVLCASSVAAHASCLPAGTTRASLDELKQAKFELADAARRDALAGVFAGCVGDPDPTLRDGIAFEGLSAWLRADQLPRQTRLKVMRDLYARLDAPDPDGFAHPFAALMLSEVARTDRVAPWLDDGERNAMVARAIAYETSVRDYRGYDAREGWRHGVAHGADWLMQLALNQRVTPEQLRAMLPALAAQIVPETGHAYVFGEPGRLARPVLFIAQRGAQDTAAWQAWFTGLQARLGGGEQPWRDPAWLARRHDLHAFLTDVYARVDQSEDANIAALKPSVAAALKALQ